MLLLLLDLYLLVLCPQELIAKDIVSLSSLKMKKGVSSSFLASTSFKGEGELDLF